MAHATSQNTATPLRQHRQRVAAQTAATLHSAASKAAGIWIAPQQHSANNTVRCSRDNRRSATLHNSSAATRQSTAAQLAAQSTVRDNKPHQWELPAACYCFRCSATSCGLGQSVGSTATLSTITTYTNYPLQCNSAAVHNPWQQQPAECRLQQITGCDKSAYSEAATRPLQQISHCRERKRRILTGTDRHNHAHTELTPWANKNWAAYHRHYHQMGDSTWWSAQGWAYRHATFAQSSKLKTQNIGQPNARSQLLSSRRRSSGSRSNETVYHITHRLTCIRTSTCIPTSINPITKLSKNQIDQLKSAASSNRSNQIGAASSKQATSGAVQIMQHFREQHKNTTSTFNTAKHDKYIQYSTEQIQQQKINSKTTN